MVFFLKRLLADKDIHPSQSLAAQRKAVVYPLGGFGPYSARPIQAGRRCLSRIAAPQHWETE